jgi:hypothetical protein
MALTEAQKRAQKKYYAKIRLDPEYRQNKRDYATKYRKENPVKVANCLHEWYSKNKVTHRANAKKWATENKEKDLLNHRKWVNNNRQKVLKSNQKCHKRMRDELEDTYVKGLLTNHNSILKFKHLPQSLIEAKRLEIQMKRHIKETQNG